MAVPCGSLIDFATTGPSISIRAGFSAPRWSASVRLGNRSTATIRGTARVQPSSASSTTPDQIPNRPLPRDTGTTTRSGTCHCSDSAISNASVRYACKPTGALDTGGVR